MTAPTTTALPGRVAPLPVRVRARLLVTVTVDPSAWDGEYGTGTDPARVRADLAAYLSTALRVAAPIWPALSVEVTPRMTDPPTPPVPETRSGRTPLMTSPTTSTTPPTEIGEGTWIYWVAYTVPGGTAAGEISRPAPITRAEHVFDAQSRIATATGHPRVVITTWTLLRVEDAPGRVIA